MIRISMITTVCLLFSGSLLALDFTETRTLAEQGNALGQHNLGLLYGRGQGVKHECAEVYIWKSLAATFGNQDAIKNRDVLLAKLSEEELKAAQGRDPFCI